MSRKLEATIKNQWICLIKLVILQINTLMWLHKLITGSTSWHILSLDCCVHDIWATEGKTNNHSNNILSIGGDEGLSQGFLQKQKDTKSRCNQRFLRTKELYRLKDGHLVSLYMKIRILFFLWNKHFYWGYLISVCLGYCNK